MLTWTLFDRATVTRVLGDDATAMYPRRVSSPVFKSTTWACRERFTRYIRWQGLKHTDIHVNLWIDGQAEMANITLALEFKSVAEVTSVECGGATGDGQELARQIDRNFVEATVPGGAGGHGIEQGGGRVVNRTRGTRVVKDTAHTRSERSAGTCTVKRMRHTCNSKVAPSDTWAATEAAGQTGTGRSAREEGRFVQKTHFCRGYS